MNEGTNRRAQFIPNTDLIYFRAHDGNGWYRSFVCNADGTDDWKDISYPYHTWGTQVSPLGSKLLFIAQNNYYLPGNLIVANIDGTGKTIIKSNIPSGNFLFTADDSKVIWPLDGDIYVTDIDGAHERLVINDATCVCNTPDKDVILCRKTADDGNDHIFKLNIIDSSLTQYSFGNYNDDSATVNPQKNYIAFMRSTENSPKNKLVVQSIAFNPIVSTPPGITPTPQPVPTPIPPVSERCIYQYVWSSDG